MGFFSGLLTFPLAPVRGVQGLSRVLAEEAERQLDDPELIRSELANIEQQWEDGTITAEQRAAAEDALISRLVTRRELDGGHG